MRHQTIFKNKSIFSLIIKHSSLVDHLKLTIKILHKKFVRKASRLVFRAEIHQALLSHFPLLLIRKGLVKERDSRVSKLVNLNPDVHYNLSKN
jgi:hypothetical protein